MPQKNLKFLSFNVQDLFLFLDKYQGENLATIDEKTWSSFSISLKKNKSLEKIIGIQKVIQETNPDIILLTEIGGLESLENFNKYFLTSSYQSYLLPTNSNRGIDLGYLVKKKFHAKLISHKNFVLSLNEKFSRDVAELRVYFRNQLKVIFLGVHLKSKLDKDKKDFEGRKKRALEIEGLKKIYLALRKKYHLTPLIVAGDFNGILEKDSREPEFEKFMKETHLIDILDLSGVPQSERYTYLYFFLGEKPWPQQIDYILMEKKFEDLLDKKNCFVYRFKNSFGDELEVKTIKEKWDLPSDHFPVVMTLKI
jgi:endonuclease/exonuclease/phosphatase family metal-dependent hydrolase